MVRPILWRGIDLAAEARAGSSLTELADKAETTEKAVRVAASVRGVTLPRQAHKSTFGPREHIQDMTPNEAIEYLLELIETQMPYLQPTRPHALDVIAPSLTASEKLLAAALFDASPRTLTHEHLYSIVYDQRPDGECPDAKVLAVLISTARKKIPPSFGVIENVWGRGYRFIKAESGAVQNGD